VTFSDLADRLTPARIAFALAISAAAVLAGAWVFQYFGYPPCDLCLQQRWAYYAGAPLAVGTALVARMEWRRMSLSGFLLLAALFFGNSVFGAWHAGVEWGFWPGPAGCTGSFAPIGDMRDFMRSMEATRLVRCDEVALRILGLSLAGWNAVICAALSCLAIIGAARARK
jgi:disulfide bond formation protein DsbB